MMTILMFSNKHDTLSLRRDENFFVENRRIFSQKTNTSSRPKYLKRKQTNKSLTRNKPKNHGSKNILLLFG